MYDQSLPFGLENGPCQKQTPKDTDKFSDRVILEGAGGQTDDTRSTFSVREFIFVEP